MGTHKVSVGLGLAGYLLLVVEMSGLGVLLRPLLAPTTALVLLWYGLYFGILGRDAAEVASDRMVRSAAHDQDEQCHEGTFPGFRSCVVGCWSALCPARLALGGTWRRSRGTRPLDDVPGSSKTLA